jgi:hypothetical protein
MDRYVARSGSRFPPGANLVNGGINFCVFSRDAARVQLLLFEAPDAPEPFQVIPLAPEHNRTFHFWHVLVEDLPLGTCYSWRMDGPQDTEWSGRRFDSRKDLLDPWARAVTDRPWDRSRQRFADQRLVLEGAVGLGRVEEGHATLVRRADKPDPILPAGGGAVAEAEAHAAIADGRDLEAGSSEYSFMHGAVSLMMTV